MRISQNYSYLPHCSERAAVPAPARKLLETNTGFLEDTVAYGAIADPAAKEARLAELRRQVRSGTYRPDLREVSAKLIDQHLERS